MSVYYQLYDILSSYLYGAVELTSYQELTLTLFCTGACLLCVAMPIAIVYGLVRMWMR